MRPVLSGGSFFGTGIRTERVAGLVLVDASHPAWSTVPRHEHERAYFCLNRGGPYDEHFDRRRRVCLPGMLVFHPAGEVHRQTHGGAGGRTLNVELEPEWLTRLFESCGPLHRPVEFYDDEVAAKGARLLREFEHPDRDSPLAIESLACEILAACAGARGTLTLTGAPAWLRRSRDLVDAAGPEPPTLRSLARQAGVHPVHFAAMFRRYHGCSVGEYARRQRLQTARASLADRSLTLAQVAAISGFSDQSHLTRAFRRFAGMTPGQYRTFLGFKTG
jgi:AraC family transcriptional regulator